MKKMESIWERGDDENWILIPFLFILFFFFRCNARRKRGTVHSETETVLCSFWLCSRSSKWLEMEGSEKGRLKRNGGICHPQSGSCHRCHISRSYTNGTIEIDDAVM